MQPDKRTDILDALADHVLAHGLEASSLRPLADAAGTSDRMLIYHFKDKASLVEAILEHIASRFVGKLDRAASSRPLPFADLRRHLVDTLLTDEMWPYMRLWLEIAGRAARGDETCRTVGEALGRGFLDWGAAQLDSDNREVEAAALLAYIEGAALLTSIGLEDVARRGTT